MTSQPSITAVLQLLWENMCHEARCTVLEMWHPLTPLASTLIHIHVYTDTHICTSEWLSKHNRYSFQVSDKTKQNQPSILENPSPVVLPWSRSNQQKRWHQLGLNSQSHPTRAPSRKRLWRHGGGVSQSRDSQKMIGIPVSESCAFQKRRRETWQRGLSLRSQTWNHTSNGRQTCL